MPEAQRQIRDGMNAGEPGMPCIPIRTALGQAAAQQRG